MFNKIVNNNIRVKFLTDRCINIMLIIIIQEIKQMYNLYNNLSLKLKPVAEKC